MVLALAGATLLYSGCTKDYQKDIDDLNNEVGALSSTVQDLQKQVAVLEQLQSKVGGLEQSIKECKDAIAALQANGATKQELQTLQQNIEKALNDLAGKVGNNTEAIALLAEAYGTLNLEKISSVALVPSNPLAEPLYQFNLTVGDEFPETLIDTYPQLYLQYAVRPYWVAESLNDENTALHVVYNGYDVYLPLRQIEGDAETGNVYIVADIPAELYPFEYFPFSLEIADIPVDGVVNNIKSPFNFAFNTGIPTNLKYAAYDEATGEAIDELPSYEVPWNEFATSERTFFDGVALGLELGWSGIVLPLDEAAACMGVDVADITPDSEATFVTPSSKSIAVDDDYVAKMTATKAEDAVKAVGDVAAGELKYFFTLDYLPFYVLSLDQTYEVIPAEGKTITVDGYNFPWVGKNNTPEAKIKNVATSDKINFKGNKLALWNEDFKQPIILTKDAELVTVEIPNHMFEFAPEEQSYTFTNAIMDEKTQTYDIVEFTVTIDPKPADKEVDLGVFYVDGSLTQAVSADLAGAVAGLIGEDEPLYKNFDPTPFYEPIAGRFDFNNELIKVVAEYADGEIKKLPYQAYDSMFAMSFDYDDEKDADKSALALNAGYAIYGTTYTFWGETKAYGVEYAYTFQVVVKEADFALVTTPYVEEGNIITDYAEIVNDLYTLNDVYFSDYFQLNKVVKDELYVAFSFDYEKNGKAYYAGNASWAEKNDIKVGDYFFVPVNAGKTTLEREGQYLNWSTYVGRQIFGEATLCVKVDEDYIPVGEGLEFTLVTPDPVKSFTVGALKTDERVAGKSVTFDLTKTVAITSQIDGLPIVPDAAWKKDYTKEHKYSNYGLAYVFVDADGKRAEWPSEIKGKLNGVDFTFEEGTHYKYDGTTMEFLPNDAYGDIEFSLSVGIVHAYDYDKVEHTASLDVTIPQHKQ